MNEVVNIAHALTDATPLLLNGAVYGFLFYILKKLMDKVDAIGKEVVALRTEHDMYKENGCPLAHAISAKGGDCSCGEQ